MRSATSIACSHCSACNHDQVLGESLSRRRFLMLLIGIFAAIALVLGLVGVYGVIAYLVGQRNRSLPFVSRWVPHAQISLWLVLSRGLFLASAGVAIGLTASVALSRVLVGTLFGVSSLDPLTYVLAPGLVYGRRGGVMAARGARGRASRQSRG